LAVQPKYDLVVKKKISKPPKTKIISSSVKKSHPEEKRKFLLKLVL
jgi:hypothetical protein